jgi:L-aspartate oxidase
MTSDAGVLRDAETLVDAREALMEADGARQALDGISGMNVLEVLNLCTVGRALVTGATARHESRGTHTRLDYPATSEDWHGRFVLGASDEPAFVPFPRDLS